jgi:hypothetical protein
MIRNSDILTKHTLVGIDKILHVFIASLELASDKLEEHSETLVVVPLYVKPQNRVRVWLSLY